VAALAPLAKKRALAQIRLSDVPILTNPQRGAGAAPYSQRLCPRGCAAAVDTEQHVLFEFHIRLDEHIHLHRPGFAGSAAPAAADLCLLLELAQGI
jgi:hypothetical protein